MTDSEYSRSDEGEVEGRGAFRVPLRRLGRRAALAAVVLLLVWPEAAGAAKLSVRPAPPAHGTVGTVWQVQVDVRRSAGEPVRVPAIRLVNRTTGERRSIVTTSTGTRDTYRAKVVFGPRGDWTYAIAYGSQTTTFPGSISIRDASSGGGSSGWKLLALVAVVVALAALTALALVLRRRPREAAGSARPAGPSPDLDHDRHALIDSCLYLYDVVRDDVIRQRLRDALAEAGVSEVDSVGARFDPAKHRATGWIHTDDPALDGRIAEVERRGFSDRGVVLRLPEVRVYSTNSRHGA